MIDQFVDENMEKQGTLFPSDSILTQRFRIIRLLGTGGMGNVYLAEDLQLSRYVAIKTIRTELSANEEVKKRIAHECRMHAAIGMHPNIVALYDRMEENGNVYLIMEYVEGILLSEFISSQATLLASLSLGSMLDIIMQVLEGLSAIHNKEIIHRDIKPANIIINTLSSSRFVVKLMDFGIARAELEDSVLTRLTTLDTNGPGTPLYMAPERIDQKLFGNLCAGTDLYSVGVILFQMLSDGPPFRGTMTEIFLGHLTRPPDLTLLKTDIPMRLKVILEKALKKQPIERYHSAQHFINDIKQFDDSSVSSPINEYKSEATLLITDFKLKMCQNEITLIDTQKINITSLKNKSRDRLWVWSGLIALAIVAVLVIGQKWIGRSVKESQTVGNKVTKTEQQVVEQNSEAVLKEHEPTNIQETIIQQVNQPLETTGQNIHEQVPALSAFEQAKKEQVTKIISSVGGQERGGGVVNVNSARSNPSTQKNKRTGGNAKCQTLLKNFKLGDSSTMQQYQKECTN